METAIACASPDCLPADAPRRGRAIHGALALVLAGTFSGLPTGAEPRGDDGLPIVERAFESARANEALVRQYVFHERVEERRFDKKGNEKKRQARTYDVTLLDGSEYRRLIAIDDAPLDQQTAAKQQNKLDKQLEKMRKETPEKREKRLGQVEREQQQSADFLREITNAFDFRRVGDEQIDGVATHVISAQPREGYRPSSRETLMLTKIRGTLWISKDDHAWVQADIEVVEPIKWAVIFKLHEGARVRFTQRKIDDEAWVPDRWTVRGRARAAFIKFNREFSGRYSNYRRFATEATEVLGEGVR